MNKLFVANLSWSVTEADLQGVFSEVGIVSHVQIILDRETQKSRGFGFVEMSTPEEAKLAIEKLNGYELGGRRLAVQEAKPKTF
jgi:RNA recognition motif-containing protein